MPSVTRLVEYIFCLFAAVTCYGNAKARASRDSVVEEPPRPVKNLKCYRCDYIVYNGRASGNSNCQARFRKMGVGEETCTGSCYKTYRITGANSFEFRRGCIQGCIPHNEDKAYTKCCSEPLCNAGSSGSRIPYSAGILTMLLSAVLSLVLGNQLAGSGS